MVSYTKYIGYGGTATLLLLISWFVSSPHFLVEYEGDKTCAGTYEDPCEWNYNITLVTIQTYYIQNKDSVSLVFLPDVKAVFHCKKDGRMTAAKRANREEYPCGIGWREFDWKSPLTSRYKYINKFYKNKKQEFKIVVFKHNPEDKIKFGGEITKDEFDPYFLPIEAGFELIQDCDTKTATEYDTCTKPVYYIHINNITKINESIFSHNVNYKCNPHQVSYQTNCKTIGIKKAQLKLMCPENYRCDFINNEFCMLDRDDGDPNYNAKQHDGRGWSYECIPINDLKEGKEIQPTKFKKTIARVERI